MNPLVLAAVGLLESTSLLAASEANDWLLSAIPQLGAIALLLWFMQNRLQKADQRAEAAEADSRELRDAFIKDMVPTMVLQNERSAQLLQAQERVVGLVERVVVGMTST